MNVKFGNVDAIDGFYPYARRSRHEASPLDNMTHQRLWEVAKSEGVSTELGGGDAPEDVVKARLEGKKAFRSLPGNRVTEVSPVGVSIAEAFSTIVAPNDGVWVNHSASAPAWVESDSPGLAQLLSEHFGCPVGRPKNWDGLEVGGGK